MSYDKVTQVNGNIIIGTKQSLKALKDGRIKEIVIADDADIYITSRVIDLAEEKQIPVSTVESMKKLGKACGIDVGAAIVAIKK